MIERGCGLISVPLRWMRVPHISRDRDALQEQTKRVRKDCTSERRLDLVLHTNPIHSLSTQLAESTWEAGVRGARASLSKLDSLGCCLAWFVTCCSGGGEQTLDQCWPVRAQATTCRIGTKHAPVFKGCVTTTICVREIPRDIDPPVAGKTRR